MDSPGSVMGRRTLLYRRILGSRMDRMDRTHRLRQNDKNGYMDGHFRARGLEA